MMIPEGNEQAKVAEQDQQEPTKAATIIDFDNGTRREQQHDDRRAASDLSRQSVVLPQGVLEFRARELSPTALIKRVEIEEYYVDLHDSQTSNQIDRTYHITISTDAADDTPEHQETVRFLTTDVMRSFNANNTMASEDNYNTSQSNLAASARRQRSSDREDELAVLAAEQQLQRQQQQMAAGGPAAAAGGGGGGAHGAAQQATRPTPIADEMSQDLQYLSREAPLDGGESTFGAYSTLGGSQLVQPPGQDVTQQQLLHQLRTPTPGDEARSDLESDYQRTTDFRITGDDGGDESNGVAPAALGAEQLARQQQRSQQQLEQLAPDNVDIQRPLQQAGPTVSFMTTTDELEQEVQRKQEVLGHGQQGQLVDDGQHWPIDSTLTDSGRAAVEQNEPNQLSAQFSVKPTSRPKSTTSTASRHLKPFLVSFMVDARGGAMRGSRHSGVRVIIPPNSAQQPTRITCRYLRRERLVHPPPLMEGEACASKIMEVGPAGAKFLGPVLIEVPHFASLRGKEREITILRSDSGEVWREHLVETNDELIDSILRSAEIVEQQQQQQQENNRPGSPLGQAGALSDGGGGDSQHQQQQQERRLTRIVTTEFPQYFAIISRIRQEVHTIGPDGSVVDSHVVPRVQAIFTDGALTKRIKIGLQKKDASTEQIQEAAEHQGGLAEERARSPNSVGRPGSSAAGKRRSRFLACFGGKHGSLEFGLDQQATDGELGFASGSNDDSPASSTGGDSPRHYAANGKPVGGGHRRVADVSDSEGDSLTLERQQRARGPPRRRSLAGEHVPDDYYIEREPALILNGEPTTYGKRMASSAAQTDAKSAGSMSTSTRHKGGGGGGGGGKRSLLLGVARRSRSKTPMQIPFYEPASPGAGHQSSQSNNNNNNNSRPRSTEPGASTAYSSLESNGDHELDGLRSSLSDLSEGAGLVPISKFRTCTVQTDSDSVTVQYVTLAALPAPDATKVLSATTTTGGLDDGYVSGSGDAKKAGFYRQQQQQQQQGKRSFLSSCMSTQGDLDEDQLVRKDEKKRRGKSSDRARTLESVRESAASTEPPGRRSVSLSRSADSHAGKLIETITTTTTTTMSQSFDVPPATEDTLSNGEDADESLLMSTHSGGGGGGGSPAKSTKKKLTKLEKEEKLRLKELERQRRRELEAAEKARKKAEKEARKSASRAQSPVAEQRQILTSDSGEGTPATRITQNVKFAPSPNKDYRGEKQKDELGDFRPEVDNEQQVTPLPTGDELERTKSKNSSSKFKIKLPKINLGATKAGNTTESSGDLETTTIERVITSEQVVPGTLDEDNSMVHLSIGDATVVAVPDAHEPIASEMTTLVSQTSTASAANIQETQDVVKQAAPLKPILKHQQSTVSESEEPKSLASLADRVVTKATEDAVQMFDDEQLTTTVTTSSEVSTSTFPRASAETVSVSECKREQARRIKAEKERQKAERDQIKLDMKLKREEEKRLIKEAQRAARQAEEAAKLAEREAKKASVLGRDQAERQAKIAQFESEQTIKEIESRESQTSEAPTTSATSSDPSDPKENTKTKTKTKKKKKNKEKKPSNEGDQQLELVVETETKTETSEFFLEGEQPQEQQQETTATSGITSEQVPHTDTPPTKSKLTKKISIGLPKISLDLGRKKRQVSQDEAPDEALETVVVEDFGTDIIGEPPKVEIQEQQTTSGLETLITPHEMQAARPPSPAKRKVRAKPRGFRMNCFLGRRAASSASESSEDLTKSRASKQVELTSETSMASTEPVKRGKIRARSKLDKETRKRERRASETDEEFAERTTKTGGFLSRIFRSRSPKSRPSSPKQRHHQVEVIKSEETSHFDLAGAQQPEREQIVSEMYPSDPDNADGEMILEVNVPEELVREQHQQPARKPAGGELATIETVTTTTTTTSQFDIDGREQQQQPASPTTEQPSQQVDEAYHATSTTPPTYASEDQEATLVNVSQLAQDEQVEVDEDEATENVVSQTQELPRDPAEPAPVAVAPSAHALEAREPSVELDGEKVEVTRVITEEQLEAPESQVEVTREVVEELEGVPDPKREKERKELEARLEREAKKRAKEDEKLRKKREKQEVKLAALEAKQAAKEEKERLKREAKELKRLADLAKREAKRTSKTKSPSKKTSSGDVEPADSAITQVISTATTAEAQEHGDRADEEASRPTTITTTTVTTSSTTQGDESALNSQLNVDGEQPDRVLLASSSASEVPVNEQTELERTVEEVMGEDGTMTKTTKVVETKYITMRQEEVRVAERKDIPRDEWNKIQAERTQAQQQQQQQQSSESNETGAHDIIETYRTRRHYIVREPLDYPTPELDEIRATPSYFDAAQLPAEIKPQSSIKKQFVKRVRLNQRIIKRAQKLSRSEAKKAKRDQRRAEAEIAACDCAARQARKELKRAVEEAKRAVKEAEKRHKKMDKIDKEIAKRQRKLEKRQKKIDKKLAKLAKKQAKKQAKLEKRALKEAKGAASSGKSIRLEDIGAPVLRSSSRASIQQLASASAAAAASAAAGAGGAGSQAIERHLIITEEGTRTHVMRQSSKDSHESSASQMAATSPETIIVNEAGDQQVVVGPQEPIRSGSQADTSPAEVPMSLDDATLMEQQEQQQLVHRESIASCNNQMTGGSATELAYVGQQEQADIERVKREAEHADAMQRELESAREEHDEVIDVVGVDVDEDQPEESESAAAAPEIPVVEQLEPPVAPTEQIQEEHKPEQETELLLEQQQQQHHQQEDEQETVDVDVDVDVDVEGLAEVEPAQIQEVEQQKQDSSNGSTPSKKSKRNKKKKQKSTESVS